MSQPGRKFGRLLEQKGPYGQIFHAQGRPHGFPMKKPVAKVFRMDGKMSTGMNKKTWLFRVYRGLYNTVKCGL